MRNLHLAWVAQGATDDSAKSLLVPRLQESHPLRPFVGSKVLRIDFSGGETLVAFGDLISHAGRFGAGVVRVTNSGRYVAAIHEMKSRLQHFKSYVTPAPTPYDSDLDYFLSSI
jgi:hypothetical protein